MNSQQNSSAADKISASQLSEIVTQKAEDKAQDGEEYVAAMTAAGMINKFLASDIAGDKKKQKGSRGGV